MIRVAMWSGPRNISTALMRSFENRPDTVVVDEPLYAHYLHTTGLDHPGAADVLAAQDNDWRKVVAALHADVPGQPAVFYQKHMAHHICGDMDMAWMDGLRHAFLLREPRAMLVSLSKVLPVVRVADTGLAEQVKIFRYATGLGQTPPVLDARDVLREPRRSLQALCAALGIRFDARMLAWPAGRRASDGVWARHWYKAVEQSTGFLPYVDSTQPVPAALHDVLAQCERLYQQLTVNRMKI